VNRREFLLSSTAAVTAPAARRPNVLFLMSDEHSPHAAGWLGNRIVRTPALDSLAAAGVTFGSAYCQNPICVPSRASFATGRMPSNVGVFGNDGGLRPDAVTLADVFREAGYTTAWFGKTHWGGNPRFQIQPGRDAGAKDPEGGPRSRLPEDARVSSLPLSAEVDTLAQQQTISFLKEHGGKPFFAGCSFIKPHFPFLVQDKYYQLYKDIVDVPEVTQEMLDELPQVSRLEREKYGFARLTPEQIRKARAIYFGMVTYIDELLGGILRTVDDLGLRRNTIILYTADHGELAGEHGLWYKNSFYEASVRVPHVWSFPGTLPAGRTLDSPVMNMEIFPTLCGLCGLKPPPGLEGRSWLPLLDGKEDGSQRRALSENFRAGWASRMIRAGRWKYCYFHDDREQLFDLVNDPREVRNVVSRPEHRDLVASLKRQALEGWNREEYFSRSGRKKAKQRQ
jgi:choline-sulfatase